MSIKGKLAAGLLAMALLAAVAGGFGIAASRQGLKAFEGSEEHFRSIVWATTEMTSYAKRAEGHLLQFLVLGDNLDREKFFLRYAAMREQIAILDSQIRIEEARLILQDIAAVEGEILASGSALLDFHAAAYSAGRVFRIEEQQKLLERFEKAVHAVEEAGLRLAHLETGFLNKQEAITAATELSSFIKQAECHLMIYLLLGRPADRERYIADSSEVRGETAHLEERLKTPESRLILKDIQEAEEEFSKVARGLIRERELVAAKGPFDNRQSASGIRKLNAAAAKVREGGVEIAKIETAMESSLKRAAIAEAGAIRRNILLTMAALVVASLIIGLLISRAILVPIRRLKMAVLQLGAGNLEVRIEGAGTDEIGTLAACFNRMAADLQDSLVSVDYVENILQSMMDAVVVLGADLKIQRVNAAACTLSGFAEQELLHRPLGTLIDGAGGLLEAVLAEGAARRPEVNLRGKDGRKVPVLFSGSIIRGPQGPLTGVVLALRDVSDLRRAEMEKQELQAQLLHAQKLETIGTLAGGIAHDFNNLLTPILGFSQICRDEVPPGSSMAGCLDRVIAAAERGRDLVRQIVTFSRQDDLHLRHVQLGPVVRDAAALLLAALPKSIVLRAHIEEDITVLANPTQIHQVVMNLGTNALQAMEDRGGTLEIRLESVRNTGVANRRGDFVLLMVSDSGCGIEREVMGRIFEPFFTTKEVGKGTGLGLSVVHGVVRGHGGEIIVESQPGQGTAFRIYLPVAAAGVDQPAGPAEREPAAGVSILLVDDEEAVVLLGREVLERLGHRVTTATNPGLALDLFRAEPGQFDLLVTDYSMPGQDGIALARAVKAIRPEFPVIMMTGLVGGLSSEIPLNSVIQACIAKPFLPADIDQAVRQVLAAPAPGTADSPLLRAAASR